MKAYFHNEPNRRIPAVLHTAAAVFFLLSVLMLCTLAEAGEKSYRDELAAAVSRTQELMTEASGVARDMAGSAETISGTYLDKDTGVSQQMLDEHEAFCQEKLSKIRELKGTLSEIRGSLPAPAAEDGTLAEAADKYYEECGAVLSDLETVVGFYCDQYEAQAPLVEALNTPQSNAQAYLTDCYYAMLDTQEKFRAMTKPACLRDNWEHYTDAIDGFLKCMVSQSAALAFDDVLRQYSSVNVLSRMDIVLSNYDGNNFRLMAAEYRHAGEIIDGRLQEAASMLANAAGGSELPGKYLPDSEVTFSYEMVDKIYPNLYNSLDSIVNLTASTQGGKKDILINCELNGFSQTYTQKLTIDQAVTSLQIKPPVLISLPDLSKGWDTLLNLTITDAQTGALLVQENKTVHMNSIYDFSLKNDEFGIYGHDDLLAWMQPEGDEILALRRGAIEWLAKKLGFGTDTLPGYQGAYGMSSGNTDITATQLIALQAVVSAIGVRYNNGAYSLASDTDQRVLLPGDVLNTGSGICVETSLLIASAVQSAGMHPMLILTPGHCQVAVESWSDSGDYFLVETTCLPYLGTAEEESAYLVLATDEEWVAYLKAKQEQGKMYVLDCDLVNYLGIQGLNYKSGTQMFTMPDFSYLDTQTGGGQTPDDTGNGGGQTPPGGDVSIPTGNDQLPDDGTGSPGGGQTPSGGDVSIPTGNDQFPGNDTGTPSGGDGQPTGGDGQPTGGDNLPTGGDDFPSGGDGQPTGGDDQPTEGETCVYRNTEKNFSFLYSSRFTVETTEYGSAIMHLDPGQSLPFILITFEDYSNDGYTHLLTRAESVLEDGDYVNPPGEPEAVEGNPGMFALMYSYRNSEAEIHVTCFTEDFDNGHMFFDMRYYEDSDADILSEAIVTALNTARPDAYYYD